MFLVVLVAILIVGLVVHLTVRKLFDMEVEAAFGGVGRVAPAAVDRARLPPLVRAFAERATAGHPDVPDTIALTQAVEMKLRPGGGWMPVAARQTIATGETAFAWDARAAIAPLVSARVLDACVAGEGRLTVRLLGSIRMAEARGAAVTLGEVYRYLAELPWAPHAILANPSLAWRQLDERTVEVSAEAADGEFARLRLIFDADGDVVAVEVDDRPREVKGDHVATRWRGVFSDYRDFGGIRLPAHAEVSWLLDDGPFTYFRGDLVSYEAGRPDG